MLSCLGEGTFFSCIGYLYTSTRLAIVSRFYPQINPPRCVPHLSDIDCCHSLFYLYTTTYIFLGLLLLFLLLLLVVLVAVTIKKHLASDLLIFGLILPYCTHHILVITGESRQSSTLFNGGDLDMFVCRHFMFAYAKRYKEVLTCANAFNP